MLRLAVSQSTQRSCITQSCSVQMFQRVSCKAGLSAGLHLLFPGCRRRTPTIAVVARQLRPFFSTRTPPTSHLMCCLPRPALSRPCCCCLLLFIHAPGHGVSQTTALHQSTHSASAGPGLLSDLMEPDAAGKARPRRVGNAMSKRLHLLLTCEDPDAIVEAAGEAAD